MSPIVETLLKASGGRPVWLLTGYIGPSTEDVLRLYQDLTLGEYFEIPKEAVIHVVAEAEAGKTDVYVLVGTEITAFHVCSRSFRAGTREPTGCRESRKSGGLYCAALDALLRSVHAAADDIRSNPDIPPAEKRRALRTLAGIAENISKAISDICVTWGDIDPGGYGI
jgi:hypothetical protein